MQCDQKTIAIYPGVVGKHLTEIDNQTGAGAGLNDIGAAQIPFGEFLGRFPQRIGSIWKIERDPRRSLDGEPCRQIG